MALVLLALLGADARLSSAISRYEAAQFTRARDALIELVVAGDVTDADRASARAYLAATYLALHDAASARLQVKQLMRERPETKLSPATFPAELVAMAEESRAPEPVAAAPPVVSAPPSPPPMVAPPPVVALPAASAPSRALALLPFGGGQFAMGRTAQGASLLIVEALCFVAAAASLGAMESLKVSGAPLSSGVYRHDDVATARTLNWVYPVAFFTGLAVLVGGVVEALIAWPGET